LWTCYIVNLLHHELWTCGICDALSILFYCEVWYVYRSYFRFRPLPVYFPHRTFVFDVSEIPISFPFPELPFSISFPIKNMKTVMVLVFIDRFRPFSSLVFALFCIVDCTVHIMIFEYSYYRLANQRWLLRPPLAGLLTASALAPLAS
jgi:hypothetical protein